MSNFFLLIDSLLPKMMIYEISHIYLINQSILINDLKVSVINRNYNKINNLNNSDGTYTKIRHVQLRLLK